MEEFQRCYRLAHRERMLRVGAICAKDRGFYVVSHSPRKLSISICVNPAMQRFTFIEIQRKGEIRLVRISREGLQRSMRTVHLDDYLAEACGLTEE